MVGPGVYVHIPFCLSRCNYCDFVSFALPQREELTERQTAEYLSALMDEAALYRPCPELAGVRFNSLYIGGGTPTCLTGGQLYILLETLQSVFAFTVGAEVTVEGNPGTLDPAKLHDLKRGGCNRLSLGVQSFTDQDLRMLGRIHSAQDVDQAYNDAREAGFDNISIDLMYGLPGQDLAGWRGNLERAVKLGPEHISLYQLNIEKGTPFHELLNKGLLAEFDEDIALAMYEEAIRFLKRHGYLHYEISNFAKPGRESRHNKLYWERCEYLGLGAGASGFLGGVRYTNLSEPEDYRRAVRSGAKPVREEERIDAALAMSETMFLGLRLLQGVDKASFYRNFNITLQERYGEVIAGLKNRGLLEESKTHIFLSTKGLHLANLVFMEFMN